MLWAAGTHAQELEPRTYSASPVGTNFVFANYTYLTGDVLTDPSLPITNVQSSLSAITLGYVRTFGLFGNTASFGFALPFVTGDITGNVIGAPTGIHRAGLGDLRLRFAYQILGAPALTPDEFTKRTLTASLGASLSVVAPTGQYVPYHLVNIGANRWAFKPEMGISQPWGNWFAEASAGIWFFTNNRNFFLNNTRSQDPLATFQIHAGYNFRPGLWISFDAGYIAGGRTAVNGVPNEDRQANSRYGLTFSVPVARGWSTKLALSKGFITRAGGDYKAVSVTLQYRWFDR
jgi:hypothetical protein